MNGRCRNTKQLNGTRLLSEAAQREWNRLVGELSKINLLTHLDRAALAAYCNAYAM